MNLRSILAFAALLALAHAFKLSPKPVLSGPTDVGQNVSAAVFEEAASPASSKGETKRSRIFARFFF